MRHATESPCDKSQACLIGVGGERRQIGTTEADELFLATRARLFLISLRSNELFLAAQENAQWRYKSYLRMLGTAW